MFNSGNLNLGRFNDTIREVPKLWTGLIRMGAALITPVARIFRNTPYRGLHVRFTNSNRIGRLSQAFLRNASLIIEDYIPTIVYLPAAKVIDGLTYCTVCLAKVVTDSLQVCQFVFTHVKDRYVAWSFIFASDIPVVIMRYNVGEHNVNVGIGRTATNHALEVEGSSMQVAPHGWFASQGDPVDIKTMDESAVQILQNLTVISHKVSEQYRLKHPSIEDEVYYNIDLSDHKETLPTYTRDNTLDLYAVNVLCVKAIQELATRLDNL